MNLCSKNLEQRAAQFSDHFAFNLLSNISCMNFELHEFFLSPKNVHLKALVFIYLNFTYVKSINNKIFAISEK